MLFQFGFYSSLLLIFFVHGLVYALLLFRKGIKNEIRSDKWLGAFLILCILYITPWMVGFGGWYDAQPYRDILFYVPFQHLYFIGPVIFFYVQSLLNPTFRFGKKEWLHMLPGMLYLLFSFVVVVTDKLVLKRYYFLAAGQDPDFDTWYQVTGFISMLVYFLLSLRYYTIYRRFIVQVISYAEVVMFRWVQNFLLAFLLMLLVRFGFYISDLFIKQDYWNTWWYFLSFAVIFYYIAITGYSNAIETKVAFRPVVLLNRAPLRINYQTSGATDETITEDADIIEIEDIEKTIGNEEDQTILDTWKSKIVTLLHNEKVYEDPELSLSQMAKQLQTNPSLLSKMINQGFQQNFNDFINFYRVDAVKAMIDKAEHKQQTLLAIAFECGFNSKATFNRAFKKRTGLSPKEYISSL